MPGVSGWRGLQASRGSTIPSEQGAPSTITESAFNSARASARSANAPQNVA